MQTSKRKSIKWWNSLPAAKVHELILDTWNNEGHPEPIVKKVVRGGKYGIKLDGWGERRKMLTAFPGGMVFFDLCDQKGAPVGIAVTADMESTRDGVLSQARDEYIEMTGREPKGLILRYSETFG